MAHWPPTRGDSRGQLERFTLTGITATWSFRGMLWAEITATEVNLYRDVGLGSSDKVATGSHSTPTSFTKITLSQANSSGISGSVYLKYSAADAAIEVWPSFATDTEVALRRVDITRWPYPGGATTFYALHKRCMEEFVCLMRQRVPPKPGQLHPEGSRRSDYTTPWRVNSVGDYELVSLQNLDDYRTWAEHWTAGEIYSLDLRLPAQTQLKAIQDEKKLAEDAWARVLPLYDTDQDLDADREEKRFRIERG